jgi:NAD(P)-dependent dehydrogenase (short-subunit alcohol dehydrogenase family)
VIGQEYPHVTCRCIDLQTSASPLGVDIEPLVEELMAADPHPPGTARVVARRGRQRWVQTFERVPLDETQRTGPLYRERGVYLLTGGYGGLGLRLAGHLAAAGTPTLILLGRSPLPAREDWAGHLAREGAEDRISRIIAAIGSIEEAGATVVPMAADVADREAMRGVLDDVRARFGDLHGVFHLAGVPSGRLMQFATRAEVDAVLRAKVQGTLVLDQLLRDRPLDFFVGFSSLNALLGGIGQVDYCAANAFLDAYAAANPSRAVAINWDAWREVGMAATAKVPGALEHVRQRDLATALTPGEALAALDVVLSSGLSNVAISTRDLKLRAAHRATVRTGAAATPHGTGNRPPLEVPYTPPADDLQRGIAAIWEAQLGIAPIGIHDDFFALGGHSLAGVQAIARLRADLSIDVPPSAIFEFPTVAALAAHVLEQRMSDLGSDRVGELLREAAELTEDQVRDRLAAVPKVA